MSNGMFYTLGLRTGGFTGPLADAQRRLESFKNTTASGGGQLGNFHKVMGKLSSSLGGVTAAAGGASIAIAAVAGSAKVRFAILEAYAPFDGLVRGLKTLEGTAPATQARLDKLREVAKTPGLGFEEAVRADIRLRAVGISAQDSESALKAFGNALATVGGGKADLDGVILGLSQIAAKGKISAEEINQIAERVPQVREAMKSAFGTADSEALQKLGLGTTEFIRGLTAELAKLPQVSGGARNELDNFNDTLNSIKTSAQEIGLAFVNMPFPKWLAGIGPRMIEQFDRDLKAIKKLMGITSPGLEGPDGTTEAKRQADAQAEAEAKAARDAATARAENDAAERASWQRREEEFLAQKRDAAEKQKELEAENAKQIAIAQERVYEARLTRESNLKRKIAALESEGVTTAEDVNRAKPNSTEQLRRARILAELASLQKELKELQADEAEKSARAAKQAAEKAAAELKQNQQIAASRAEAATEWDLEGGILRAKLTGNAKLIAAAEQMLAIERMKRQIMEQQGVSEEKALAMAKERVALDEKAANPKARKGLLSAAESTAARLLRRSAADQARDTRRGEDGLNQADRLAKINADRLRDLPGAVNRRATNGTPIGKREPRENPREQGNYFDRLIAATTAIDRKLSAIEAV